MGTAAETTLVDILDGWRLVAGDPMEGGVGTGGLLECDQPFKTLLEFGRRV